MKVKLWPLLISLARMPIGIQKDIGLYYLTRIIGWKATKHQIIWTSFLYYAVENAIGITQEGGLYLVDFELRERGRVRAYIRKAATSDILVFFQVFIADGYKPLLDFMKSKSFSPRIIVDAGANVGYFSILMNGFYPDAQLVCVEPSNSNFVCLKRNMKAMENKIQLMEAALWTSDRKLEMRDESAEEWAFQLTDMAELGKYDGISLSSLMQRAGIEKIDLLKIDIEGAEGNLFNDFNFLSELGRVAVLAMEIHDQYVDRKQILHKLEERGFVYFEQGELTVACNNKWLAA